MKSASLCIALVLSVLWLDGCSSTPSDPNNPGGNGTTATMEHVSSLPSVGGYVTGVALNPDGSIVAVIDGKLYTLAAAGADPVLISAESKHTKVAIGSTGEIYSVTDQELRTYTNGGASVTAVPFPPGTVTSGSNYVTDAKIIVTPSGIPIITVTNNYPQAFVFYSTDQGASWQSMGLKKATGENILTNGSVDIAAMPNGDLLIASASFTKEICRSTDMGLTWTKLSGTLPNAAVKMMITASGDIYTWIPSGSSLRVSKDGGASFQDLTPFNAYPFFTHVVEGAGNTLYALESSTGLQKSTDGGTTWTLAGGFIGNDLAAKGANLAIGTGTSGSTRSGGISASSNAGTYWAHSGLRPMEDMTDMDVDKDGNVLFVGNRTVFRKSGAQWHALGSSDKHVYVSTTPTGRILTGSYGALSLSDDNGVSWKHLTTLPGYLYAGQGQIELPSILGRANGDFIISVAAYRNDLSEYTNSALFILGSDGVPRIVQIGPGGPVTRLMEDASGNVYASVQQVDPFTGQFSIGIHKSTDGGTTWTKTGENGKAVAVNSQNTALSFGGDTQFTLGPLGSTSPRALTLAGFTSQANYITRIRFGPDDRLYILTADKGIFVSQAAVR